jgi:tetratricopeptide (TPR) repeat protein
MEKVYNKKMKENIKYQKSNIKNALKNTKIFKYLFFIIIFTFLFLNLISSQMIPPLYFKFINEDKKSIISFLQDIKNLKIFGEELNKSKNLFGKDIENEVFQPEIENNNKIKEFEQILIKNPQSRDILYSLSRLYLKKGDIITANNYLKQAKAVDPNIN